LTWIKDFISQVIEDARASIRKKGPSMKRKIISIDEEKCNGCGECVPTCPEGAIQIVNGKARLMGDLLCDGLGACLGHCPEGAISVEEREAEAYDERKVMENVIQQGETVVTSHLKHLEEHQQHEYLQQALEFLREPGHGENRRLSFPNAQPQQHHGTSCPGSRFLEFARPVPAVPEASLGSRPSELAHWPIQLHLMSPLAPHYRAKDVVLAADCVAYAMGDFHRDYLQGKALAIACPKLDEGQERYLEKVIALIDQARINTLTVLIMQVPCCQGLLRLAQAAASRASRKVPIKSVVVGLQGEVLQEQWV
jgi:ferredoxin